MTALAHSLRVLVVLPLYGGSLPVGRFCVEGLKELGHTVEVFEAPSFHSAFSALKDLRVTTDRLEYLENSFLQVVSQAVLAKVETFEPDLVLCLAQAPLNRQALKRLRKDGVATAMWFVEDYRLFTYWRGFAPFYDFFAVIQHEPLLSELRDIGVDNALYLPMAALPSMHRKLELSPAEQRKYGSDVSFLGAGYPNRRIAFRQLTHLDFKIWGTEWDGEPLLERHVQMKGARISSEDCVKIYNATRINLNLHSSVDARELVSGGDFVNPRTFELAACGAFQLVDRRTLMGDLFADDELVTFGSMEELLDNIQTYLGDESARVAVAEKAKARVLRDHTYTARMRTLTEFIASRREGWPAPRKESAALPADIPAELREELAALMQRLGIPADAAFQDIVWAIRQQNGQLSSVETAVLFLDEWKKQYQQ
jgi:spore maturation protein CgeB